MKDAIARTMLVMLRDVADRLAAKTRSEDRREVYAEIGLAIRKVLDDNPPRDFREKGMP